MVFQPPCWFKKHHWLGQPIKTLTVDVLTFDVQIAVKWLCIGIVHEGIRYWWYKHTMYVYSSYLYDFFRGRSAELCQIASSLIVSRFFFLFRQVYLRELHLHVYFFITSMFFFVVPYVWHMVGTFFSLLVVGTYILHPTLVPVGWISFHQKS